MRKAVIVPFALGMVIMTGLFLFGGSVADEILLKNRYFKLKEFTEKAVLGAANYYNNNQDITEAESKTHSLMQLNPLYSSVSNQMEFFWDTEDEVMVRINHHEFKPFWMRMFGMDVIDIDDVNSTAMLTTNNDTLSPISNALMPIAINEQDLEIGDKFTLRYETLECEDVACCDFDSGFGATGSFGGFSGSFDFSSCNGFSMGGSFGGFSGGIDFGTDGCSSGFPWFPSMTFSEDMTWDPDDKNSFYGIDLSAGEDLPNGVSHNAHWKNIISGSEIPEESYNSIDINLLKMMSNVRFLCADVGDTKETAQLQQAVNAFKQAEGKTFDVVLVNDQADISGFITINLNNVDSKNGNNGYLNIDVEVVENQNNKNVKLVD